MPAARPLCVGVTGGIGSGKSALTQRLGGKGIAIIDADVVAREVVVPGAPALMDIVSRFGAHIVNPDGTLDRPELRRVVFEDADARKDLEAITHPRIREALAQQLAGADSAYVVLSSPLLFESGQASMVDIAVVVDVPESVQMQRTMARDDNDESLVARIMAAQLPRAERLQRADRVIDNSQSLDELDRQANELHDWLLEQVAQRRND